MDPTAARHIAVERLGNLATDLRKAGEKEGS
jgi:hypothetical protein